MAQKGSKKRDQLIDEEKDVFLSFINKRLRNNRKKLDQIDDLSKREKDQLKSEQLEKINSKPEVLENIKYFDKIKDMYYESIKTAKEEGRFEGTLVAKKEETTGETKRITSEPVEERAGVSRDTLSKILNLVHFAQVFSNNHKRDEFRASAGSVPEFDIVSELYTKIFTFSEADRFERVESKINAAIGELELYLNGTDKPALRNKSYKYLQETVEKIAATSFFKDQKVDVSSHKIEKPTHLSAIGSELRHEKSPQAPEHDHRGLADLKAESHVLHKKEEPKEHSPIKPVERENKPEPLTVQEVEKIQEAQRREAGHGRKNWTEVEDEEEEEDQGEEEEGVEEEKHGESQQKSGDGFIEVKSKGKEKKGDEPQGGFRGRGRGRGNRRGTGRGGRGGNRGDRGGDRGDRPRREGEEGERRGGQGGRGGYQFKKSYVEKQDDKKPGETKTSQ